MSGKKPASFGSYFIQFAAILFVLGGCLVTEAFAQSENEHVQVGVFADYFRLSQTDSNLVGIGGRASVIGYKRLKFEAEAAYDFSRAFTEGQSDANGTLSIVRTNVRLIHGLFGPRINLGVHNIQPFVTIKGGGMAFRLDNAPVTFGTFGHNVGNLRVNSVSPVLYPGGGLEGHIGPIGLRADVGDEIYFNHGAHHNLRVTFGPVFRF